MKIFRPNNTNTNQMFIIQMWQKEYEHLEKVIHMKSIGKGIITSHVKLIKTTIRKTFQII